MVVSESVAEAELCTECSVAADKTRAIVARRVRKDIPALRRFRGRKCYTNRGNLDSGCAEQGGAEGDGVMPVILDAPETFGLAAALGIKGPPVGGCIYAAEKDVRYRVGRRMNVPKTDGRASLEGWR